jgi:hypothetical protein
VLENSTHSGWQKGKIRRLLIEMMCGWIVRMWNMVSTKIITKIFLRTEITDTLHRSESNIWVGDKNLDAEGDSELAPGSSSDDDSSDE